MSPLGSQHQAEHAGTCMSQCECHHMPSNQGALALVRHQTSMEPNCHMVTALSRSPLSNNQAGPSKIHQTGHLILSPGLMYIACQGRVQSNERCTSHTLMCILACTNLCTPVYACAHANTFAYKHFVPSFTHASTHILKYDGQCQELLIAPYLSPCYIICTSCTAELATSRAYILGPFAQQLWDSLRIMQWHKDPMQLFRNRRAFFSFSWYENAMIGRPLRLEGKISPRQRMAKNLPLVPDELLQSFGMGQATKFPASLQQLLFGIYLPIITYPIQNVACAREHYPT